EPARRGGLRRRRAEASSDEGHRMNSSGKRGLSLILVVLLVAACSSTPPKIDPEKLPPTPASFKEGDGRWTAAPPAAAQPRGEWWKAFSDPALDELMERANRGNTSIQLAAARLTQARALVRAADAERSPQVDVGVSANRLQGIVGNSAGPARSVFTAGADLSY